VAEVSGAEPDLRALARRIPEDVRSHLSPVEMHLRLVEASSLLAEAETASEVKADRMRAQAGKVLKAVSPAGYDIATRALAGEIREASLRGDTRRASSLQSELADFERRNPQPSLETIAAAGEAALSRLRIPPPVASRQSAFTRRFGGKSKKGHR
jgi:hypothetical protein